MTVETITERFNMIEKSWADADADGRAGYLTELGQLADELGRVSGPTADRGVWLERRIRRLVRNAEGPLKA